MKQSRKDELTRYIPHLPERVAKQMKGKTACNFAVMLNSPLDDTLYIRCYHRYRGGALAGFCEHTGLTPRRLARYLFDQAVSRWDYRDYLEQCEKLHYDLHDTAISMPHDFAAMHRRCSAIIRYEQTEMQRKQFAAAMADRRKLAFAYGDLLIRQPKSMDEIIAEGSTLNHCVGGYAERHAESKLHILFIRTIEKPDVPFYTMELSTTGRIRQVRGHKSAAPTPAVQAFVDAYKTYLQGVFNDKKVRKSA